MRVFITGATGFVGTYLCARLRGLGHEVVAWVRDVERARMRLGESVDYVESSISEAELRTQLAACDAVVNLAGAPIAQRWTATHRREIRTSRVQSTRRMATALQELGCSHAPALISASAVGYYGEGGEAEFDGHSPAGKGFLAEVAQAWENEALLARASGARVVLLRLGVVLGQGGGALAKMLPAFRAGLGTVIGDGRQWMSWIHIDDLVDLSVRAIEDNGMQGVYEGVAPHPVRNAEFTQTLAEAANSRARLKVPAWLLRLGMGRASEIVTGSQRVVPRRLIEHGFEFRYGDLDSALSDILAKRGVASGAAQGLPSHPYIDGRGARYMLTAEQSLPRPMAEVSEFFQRPENLGVITPPDMSFEIMGGSPIEMREGAIIDYRIRLAGLPMRWRTKIAGCDAHGNFVDMQLRGPYRSWYHVHEFEAVNANTTIVRDRVYYSPPLGILGRLVHEVFIRQKLLDIFSFRRAIITSRFAAASSQAT